MKSRFVVDSHGVVADGEDTPRDNGRSHPSRDGVGPNVADFAELVFHLAARIRAETNLADIAFGVAGGVFVLPWFRGAAPSLSFWQVCAIGWMALLAWCWAGGLMLAGLGIVRAVQPQSPADPRILRARPRRTLWRLPSEINVKSLCQNLFWFATLMGYSIWFAVRMGSLLRDVPALPVLALGAWAVPLVRRRVPRWPGGTVLARFLPRVAVAVCVAACAVVAVLVAAEPDAIVPSLGFLFPIAGWAVIRVGQGLARSQRLMVRASANIITSLLIGVIAVVVLVWMADLLELDPSQVKWLREHLEYVNGWLKEYPQWWWWALVYLALAVAGLAVAWHPKSLAPLERWVTRLRVRPAVELGSQAVSFAQLALLSVTFIGLTGPTAVAPVLRERIQVRAVVEYQRKLEAGAELFAYRAITQYLQGRPQPTGSTSLAANLVAFVNSIHHSAPDAPPDHEGAAGPVEQDLARRVGILQAQVAAASAGDGSELIAQQVSGRQGDLAARLHGYADAEERLQQVADDQRQADAAHKNAQEAGDAAAGVLASLVQALPSVGPEEVSDILKEYLSGLVEGGPLKEVFARWAQKAAAGEDNPPVATVVEFDPKHLRQEAEKDFLRERAVLPSAAEAGDMAATVATVNKIRQVEIERGTGSGSPSGPFERRPAQPEPVEKPLLPLER